MQSIELIRLNLAQSLERVLMRIEDMREHAVVFPTQDDGNIPKRTSVRGPVSG